MTSGRPTRLSDLSDSELAREVLLLPLRVAVDRARAGKLDDSVLVAISKATVDEIREAGIAPRKDSA